METANTAAQEARLYYDGVRAALRPQVVHWVNELQELFVVRRVLCCTHFKQRLTRNSPQAVQDQATKAANPHATVPKSHYASTAYSIIMEKMTEEDLENQSHAPLDRSFLPPHYDARLTDELVVDHHNALHRLYPALPQYSSRSLAKTEQRHEVQLETAHGHAAFVTQRTARRYGI